MMPTSELITVLRTGAQGLDVTIRFLILDVCDRLERKTKDNELLAQKIVELRSGTVKTNADRIRAMSDEELAKLPREWSGYSCVFPDRECGDGHTCEGCLLLWLQQPAEKDGGEQ